MDTSQWIEKLKTVTEMQVLIKDLGLTPQTQKEFWKNLLALLKGQASPISLADGQKGLFKFITDNADLTDAQIPPDELISYLYEDIKALANSQEDSYWNESLQKLIEFFQRKNILQRRDIQHTAASYKTKSRSCKNGLFRHINSCPCNANLIFYYITLYKM